MCAEMMQLRPPVNPMPCVSAASRLWNVVDAKISGRPPITPTAGSVECRRPASMADRSARQCSVLNTRVGGQPRHSFKFRPALPIAGM